MSRIILIGGPPRSGKTTLAQEVSKKLGIPWISTDAFDDVAKKYVPDVDQDRFFPKTALRLKSGGGNDEMYSTFSAEDIVSAYWKQAETVHAAVESFIQCANNEGWNYIIEGYHITPKFIAELQAENLNVSSVILISSAGEPAIERSMKSTTKKDWLRDKTRQPETFQKVANMISLFSERLVREAGGHGVKIIDMNGDFQAKFEEAARYIS